MYVNNGLHCKNVHVYMHIYISTCNSVDQLVKCRLECECCGFESHPRKPIFSLKNDCLGRVVLSCFVFLLCCCCVALFHLSKDLMDD